MDTADLLIRNARIVDGTGRPAYRGDVAVSGGRVLECGDLSGRASRETVDAQGLALCPGFVDMHTHADLALLQDPTHKVKVLQGVTTEVFTNCGLGFAPVSAAALATQRQYLSGLFGPSDRVSWRWGSVAEYLGELRQGIGANVAYLVPHGALRVTVMGMEDRPASPEEVRSMEALLEAALAEGALGMSTGLWYAPMCYAAHEESVALARVTARRGGIFAVHMREYGDGILEALDEVIDVGRRSGCPIQVSHLHTSGPRNRGLSLRLLERIDAARAQGIDVTMDSYPYLAGSTLLQALLPRWANSGGPDALRERLADASARGRMEAALGKLGFDWSRVFLCGTQTEESRALEGRPFTEISRAFGKTPEACVLALIEREDLQACFIRHASHEEDLQAILAHPAQMPGSDGLHLEGNTHPRLYGTFPRVLARYVRELGLLPLEEAVRKMTSAPCERLGLRGRGRIQPGHAADLVLFDPETIQDTATYEQPRRTPVGIRAVWVSGRQVAAEGRHLGDLPGQVLSR